MAHRYSSTQFILAFGVSILFLTAVSVWPPRLFPADLIGAALAGLMGTFQGAFRNRLVSPDPLAYPKTSSSGHQQACWYYPGNHQDRMPQDR